MIRTLALAVAAALATPALAQQGPPASPPANPPAQFGVGSGLGYNMLPSFRVTIQAPLQGGAHFRIEPFLDLYSHSSDITNGVGATVGTSSTSWNTVGVTLAYAAPVFPYAYGFVGGRLGLERHAIKHELDAGGSVDGSAIGVLVGAVAGGDVYLHPRLSLGVEAGLQYANHPKVDDGNGGLLYSANSEIVSTGEIVLRFWFK